MISTSINGSSIAPNLILSYTQIKGRVIIHVFCQDFFFLFNPFYRRIEKYEVHCCRQIMWFLLVISGFHMHRIYYYQKSSYLDFEGCTLFVH